jgi:hypothetical protein
MQHYAELKALSSRVYDAGGLENVQQASDVIENLKDKGMLKIAADGSYLTPTSLAQQ